MEVLIMEQRAKFFKMSLLQLILVAACMICLTSVLGAVKEYKVGGVEADAFFDELDAKDLGRQDLKTFYKDRSKEMKTYMKQENWFFPTRLLGYYIPGFVLQANKWGWSYGTVVNFLHWLDWALMSVIVLIFGGRKFIKLFTETLQEDNSGRTAKVNAQQQDLLLSVRGFFYVVALFFLATLGQVFNMPILLVLIALLILCFLETRRYFSKGGKLKIEKPVKRKKRRGLAQIILGIEPGKIIDYDDLTPDERMLREAGGLRQKVQDGLAGNRTVNRRR